MSLPMRRARINDFSKPITVDIVTPAREPSSVIVIKTIKYILYQRQQIPFTYEFLMDLARKGKAVLSDPANKQTTGHHVNSQDLRMLRKQYQKIIDSLEMLEEIFKNVHEELDLSNSHLVPEVMILLGSTPMSPKEVYRIILPQCNSTPSVNDRQFKTNIFQMFRGIMTCEELQNFVTKSVSKTNMFLFVKKKAGMNSPWLLPKRLYEPPNVGQHIIFSLKGSANNEQVISEHGQNEANPETSIYSDSASVTVESCEQLSLPYSEECHSVLKNNCESQETEKEISVNCCLDEMHWYQAKHVFRGFAADIKL